MKDAKRYDAVHLRYEDSNIRYGEGCEVEVVAAYDYDELKAVSRELLEALEELYAERAEWIRGGDHGGEDDENHPMWKEMQRARMAIAKARGEA